MKNKLVTMVDKNTMKKINHDLKHPPRGTPGLLKLLKEIEQDRNSLQKIYENEENRFAFLKRLHKKMHNWFWLGVEYDWDFNKETGKIWVYKDCTGIVMKAKELSTIIMWVNSFNKL